MEESKVRNNKQEFVNAFAKSNGYPFWDKVLLSKRIVQNTSFASSNSISNPDTLLAIPFSLPNQLRINGFLKIKINDSIRISYSLACDYKNYPYNRNAADYSAESFAVLVMSLEKLVFGYKNFVITDSLLFQENNNNIGNGFTVSFVDSSSAAVNTQQNVTSINECTSTTIYISVPCNNVQNATNIVPGPHCGIGIAYNSCYIVGLDWGEQGSPIPGGPITTSGGGGGGPVIPYVYPCIPGAPAPVPVNVSSSNVVPSGPLPPCPVPTGGPGWAPTTLYLNYDDLDNPIFVNDDDVIMPAGYNFEFENFGESVDPPIKIIGRIASRNNTEDMTYGTNCDASGIMSNMTNFTNQELFNEVTDLFHKTSTGILETVGDNMVERFKNNLGGTYSNTDLSNKVFENSKFKEFMIKFGVRLNTTLAANNWDINTINTLELPQAIRPAFNGLHNKFNGLQILINDTEETIIELTGFSIDPITHKWTANLNITIKDHFGLDKNDAITYQNKHVGFAAWWILQHCRGFKPFETQVKFKMNLVSN